MYNNLWYQSLNKSALTPPGYVFSVTWTILYILMAISVFLYIKGGINKEKTFALWVFGIQLILNLLWSPIFFGLHNVYLAFGIILLLLILVLWVIVLFHKTSKTAAYLLVPYFLWLIFAAYLNFEIIRLNQLIEAMVEHPKDLFLVKILLIV